MEESNNKIEQTSMFDDGSFSEVKKTTSRTEKDGKVAITENVEVRIEKKHPTYKEDNYVQKYYNKANDREYLYESSTVEGRWEKINIFIEYIIIGVILMLGIIAFVFSRFILTRLIIFTITGTFLTPLYRDIEFMKRQRGSKDEEGSCKDTLQLYVNERGFICKAVDGVEYQIMESPVIIEDQPNYVVVRFGKEKENYYILKADALYKEIEKNVTVQFGAKSPIKIRYLKIFLLFVVIPLLCFCTVKIVDEYNKAEWQKYKATINETTFRLLDTEYKEFYEDMDGYLDLAEGELVEAGGMKVINLYPKGETENSIGYIIVENTDDKISNIMFTEIVEVVQFYDQVEDKEEYRITFPGGLYVGQEITLEEIEDILGEASTVNEGDSSNEYTSIYYKENEDSVALGDYYQIMLKDGVIRTLSMRNTEE